MKRFIHGFVPESGLWAVADQAVVSGGNFLLNILLARNLVPNDYGIFALFFGLMVFLNTLHGAVVTYPLSIKGAGEDLSALQKRSTHAAIQSLIIGLPLSLVLMFAGFFLAKVSLIFWAVIALVLWQLQETFRRALMAHFRFPAALIGDALSYLGQAAIIWILITNLKLSLRSTFQAIAVTSLLSILVQVLQLRPTKILSSEVQMFARESWNLGSWVLMTNSLVFFTTAQAFAWLLTFMQGPSAGAQIQSLANVLGITHPLLTSIANLIIPAAAKARSEFGLRGAWAASAKYMRMGLHLMAPFFLLLLIVPKYSLKLFYGSSSPYVNLGTGLRIFVILYLLNYFGVVLGSVLRAIEQSRWDFFANLATAGASLVIAVPCVWYFGLTGACLALAVLALLRLAVLVSMSRTFQLFTGSTAVSY